MENSIDKKEGAGFNRRQLSKTVLALADDGDNTLTPNPTKSKRR